MKIKTAYGEVFVINISDLSKLAKVESNVPAHKPIANTNKSLSGASDVKLESWYTYWGLGFSNNSYPEPLDELLDILNKIPGVTRMSINLDVLGFYKPMNSKTILGFIVNGSGNRIEVIDKVFAADSGVATLE